MTVSERTAGALLAEACELTASLPLTLGALQAGSISWQHARAMVDETSSLDPAGAQALEAHFLDPDAGNPARSCPAGELVPSRFRHKARTWRERHHPDSIEKRHARSAEDRRLEYAPDRDGMAWLSAYLPADAAAGIWNRATAAARALQGPTEPRTLTQLRADTAATWLLGAGGESASGLSTAHPTAENSTIGGVGTGGVPSPAAQVLITVPVFSLLGLTDEPAVLDGYGPIPATMAARLVADGADSFHRVLTDPPHRSTVGDRTDHCSNHSLDNEADHLLAWNDGGTTGINNLGQPCPKHHRLKHTTRWQPTPASKNEPPGWTSPTGRHYQSEQQDWEPTPWPDDIPKGLQDQRDNPEADLPLDPFPDRASFQAV
ncbi:hypothetical protein QFZ30_004363 [Arthrobacter pascens]|uniref:HNH endonuclease signature motif containing protein n=1 Tax=Arthrobacter pascens TaxID=1677 RepID=UPI00278FF588|nr:HNH endonuclease signature motif containing protein [Arthrobacter pascens]MDQ0680981.1 hypothetical protein [Arthrobacter pascens]